MSVRSGGPIPADEAEFVKLQQDALDRLESHAARWVEITSTIAGASALLGIGIKSEAIGELELFWRAIAVCLGLGSILSITWAIRQGGRAATGGTPVTTVLNYEAISKRITEVSEQAARSFKSAQQWTVIGIVLAVGFIASVMLAPHTSAENKWILNQISATPGIGRVYCGDVFLQPDSGALIFVPLSTETSYPSQPVNDFDNLRPVSSCDNFHTASEN